MELGTHLGTVKRKGKDVLENIKDEVYRVPLLQSLEQILRNDGIRGQVRFCKLCQLLWVTVCTVTYYNALQVMSGPHQLIGPLYGDMCDGELFKEHPIFSSNPQALQLILYFDELQVANPLGTKAKKNKLGKAQNNHTLAFLTLFT